MSWKIHDNPQKTAYGSLDECPPISGQCQYVPGNSNTTEPPDTLIPQQAHVHVEGPHWPIWAEMTDPFTIPFAIVLYHVEGAVSNVWGGQNLPPHIIWDATGTSEPPPMIGDPMGEVKFTGMATYNPHDLMPETESPPLKGWFTFGMVVRVILTRGPMMQTNLLVPYYSLLDPNAPEEPIKDGRDELRVNCMVSTPGNPGGDSAFGSNSSVIHRHNFPILAPFNASWPIDLFTYQYGQPPGLPPGVYELRRDLDAHHGNPGIVMRTQTANGQVQDMQPLTLAELGSLGKHKVAIDWVQTGDGAPEIVTPGQTVWSRLVVTVETTDDPNVPPPPDTDLVAVPNVVGLPTAAAATLVLAGAGFAVGPQTMQPSAAPVGQVIAQSPFANTMVAPHSVVSYTTSTGIVPLVTVPNVVGMTFTDAHVLLATLTLSSPRQDVPHEAPIGQVVAQTPVAGTSVPEHSAVTLDVSLGPVVDEWHPVEEPIVVEQFGDTDQRRLTVGTKSVVLT